MRISGTVRFPSGEPLEVEAVHVTVRDITDLDGPAPTVASLELPAARVPATGLDLPFTLDADVSDPRRMYAVRAHADRSGSGAVEPGDLVTTTAHVVRADDERRTVLEMEPVTG